MSRHVSVLLLVLCLQATTAFGTLDVPSSLTAEAEGPDGAHVWFTIQVIGGNDGEDGRPVDTVTCAPASASLFPIGTTIVSCSGSEGSTGSFPVIVTDTSGPQLSLPRDFTVRTSDPDGETVTYTATATDLVDGEVAVSCSPASGSTFPLGTHAVTCTASDSRGNSATGGFNITVVTVESPPGNPDLTVEATGPNGAIVHFNTSDSDDENGRPGSGGCSPAPGTLFPLGNTTVVCPSGNFTVSVVDTTGPALTLPGTVHVVASGPSGAEMTFSASASDLVDGAVPVSCTPPSGSTFAVGMSVVSCSAADSRGNQSEGTFVVDVTRDPRPPVDPDDITAEATGPDGAVVTFDLGLDDGGRPITCSPSSGSIFALGETTVMCSDDSSFKVVVVDTIAPTIVSITASPAILWPPNNKPVEVSVVVAADDLVDPSPLVRIYSVTCNEAIGVDDAVITGELTATLRASREGSGEGRVYTLHVEAIDVSGNRSVSTVIVVVPHDQSGESTTAKKRAVRRG